jgi:hypothetical protein
VAARTPRRPLLVRENDGFQSLLNRVMKDVDALAIFPAFEKKLCGFIVVNGSG